MEGTAVLFGVPWSLIEGATPKDKLAKFMNLEAAPFLSLVHAGGFCTVLHVGDAVVIPSGCAILSVNLEKVAVHGIKWPMKGSSANVKQSAQFLDEQIASFSDVPAASTHKLVSEYLKASVAQV